jgi:3-hydroxy-3-methylglutaryl CoA synthase
MDIDSNHILLCNVHQRSESAMLLPRFLILIQLSNLTNYGSTDLVGITTFGAYIPKLRLQRESIAKANVWFDPSLAGLARGERSICNWDEDSVTMAVEAGRDATDVATRAKIEAICLASTSLPFLDRQNAGIVAEALQLNEAIRTMDVTGSGKAGTTGLLSMIDAVKAGRESVMLVASEHRRTRVGSPLEMVGGDAAATLVLGGEPGVAEFVDSHSIATDFVDHFRTAESEFDYDWEARWVRDEGYMKLVPAVVQPLLEKADIAAREISHFILPCAQSRVPAALSKQLGISDSAIVDNLTGNCGQTGVAHPILMLALTLERAAPGDLILMVGFGQGCDALLFRATGAVGRVQAKRGVSGWLEQRRPEENYAKFQTFNDLVEREYGKRAEADTPSPLSAIYRNRKMVTSFSGGRCAACGTVQFPKSVYCVNPECGAADTQEDHCMADATGKVRTWTADRLTFDMNPPAYFGLVEFDGGGRAMMDFTDVDPETFDINTPVSAHFRIKNIDRRRGFRRYFWKAAPE